MSIIQGKLRSAEYNQAFERFTNLTGIKVIQNMEDKIGSSIFIITQIAYIHDLIQEKQYEKASMEFKKLINIDLEGSYQKQIEMIEKYYNVSLKIKELINNKKYTDAINMVQSKFNIDLEKEKEAIKIIQEFYYKMSSSYDILKKGMTSKAYEIFEKTTGISSEAIESEKVAGLKKFINDANKVKTVISSGDIDKALNIENMPNGLMALMEATMENIDYFKSIVDKNKYILESIKDGKLDEVMMMPVMNSYTYVRPNKFSEDEFLEEENNDEFNSDLSLVVEKPKIVVSAENKTMEEAIEHCENLLDNLELVQKMLNTKAGYKIAQQATDFLITLEEGSEKDLEDNKMVHKAINKQIKQLKEAGDDVDESAPIITSIEQLMLILEKIQ